MKESIVHTPIESIQDSFPLLPSKHSKGNLNMDSLCSNTVSFHDFMVRGLQSVTPIRSERPSLFFHSTHKQRSMNEKSFAAPFQEAWIFILLLSFLIVITWLWKLFRKRIGQISLACWNNLSLNQALRDGSIIQENIFVPIVFLYVASLGLVLNEGFNILSVYSGPIGNNGFIQYIVITLGFGTFVLFKNLFTKLIGALFRTDTSHYTASTWAFNFLISLMLLPLFPIYFYADIDRLTFGGIVLFLCAVFYILRLFRGFVVALNYSEFSRLYLFSYLCTAEILPVLLAWKYLTTR